MAEIADTARAFFEACESGQGWAVCQGWCTPDAGFAAQAEPLAEITTLAAYCDWMQWLMGVMPDGRYELSAFATDAARATVVASAQFLGTHTGEGGPCPPTGRSTRSDYVYVMQFDAGGRIRNMTKIWNASWAMRDLGWA
jgi:predicted ester cyclase